MVNLVVDITNIFYRAMFSTSNYGKEKVYTYDSEFECAQLIRKIAIDVTTIIRQVNPNRVILCKDSRSWRKDIEIEENEGYKGNRKKSESLNWDNIYKIQSEFCKYAISTGIIICDIHEAEADDSIAMWCEHLYGNLNETCIIISSDADVRQLITSKYDDEGNLKFVAVLNPIRQGKAPLKKIYHDGSVEKWIAIEDVPKSEASVISSFFKHAPTNPYKGKVKDLFTDEQFEKVVVNGEKIVLEKFFLGDDGDNVPAFYTWNTTTKKGNPKTVRITPKKYEVLVEKLGVSKISDIDMSLIRPLHDMLVYMSGDDLTIDVLDRINRQAKLVELKSKNFPQSIKDSFERQLPLWMDTTLNVHPLTMNMESILKGSKYLDEEYDKKAIDDNTNSSIFSDMSKLLNNF
ncbi:MAG: hypothetical protein ACRDD8_14730 [Bacteroidales bacterium]